MTSLCERDWPIVTYFIAIVGSLISPSNDSTHTHAWRMLPPAWQPVVWSMTAVHTILTMINVYWAQIHNNRYQSLKQVQRNYRPLAIVPTHAMKTRRRLSRPLVKRTVSTQHHPICHQTARSAMDLSSIYLYVLIYWHALFVKWSDTRLMALAVW